MAWLRVPVVGVMVFVSVFVFAGVFVQWGMCITSVAEVLVQRCMCRGAGAELWVPCWKRSCGCVDAGVSVHIRCFRCGSVVRLCVRV